MRSSACCLMGVRRISQGSVFSFLRRATHRKMDLFFRRAVYGHHCKDCPRGIPRLDSLLQRVFGKANIRDPQARQSHQDGPGRGRAIFPFSLTTTGSQENSLPFLTFARISAGNPFVNFTYAQFIGSIAHLAILIRFEYSCRASVATLAQVFHFKRLVASHPFAEAGFYSIVLFRFNLRGLAKIFVGHSPAHMDEQRKDL